MYCSSVFRHGLSCLEIPPQNSFPSENAASTELKRFSGKHVFHPKAQRIIAGVFTFHNAESLQNEIISEHSAAAFIRVKCLTSKKKNILVGSKIGFSAFYFILEFRSFPFLPK